ncbi:MAG: DUF5990 family protein [Gemmataceae bacterium]
MQKVIKICIRIAVVEPPPDVTFRVQGCRSNLLAPSTEGPGLITFDITLRLGRSQIDGKPNFLGEFAHGTPQDRFLYINSGVRAGQEGSCWERRAKVKLGAVDNNLLRRALAAPGSLLEARIAGTGQDGGPACGTVALLGNGWRLR